VKIVNSLMILALTISLTACSVNQNKHDDEQKLSKADQQLKQLIDDEQAYQDSLNPFAKDSEQLYYDVSPEAMKSQYQQNIALRDRLAAIDSDALSLDNRINQTILLYKLNNDIDNYRFKEHYIPLTAEAGFHAYLPYMVDRSAFKTVEDYQLYLQRLNYMPTYFDQQMYWMKLFLYLFHLLLNKQPHFFLFMAKHHSRA